MQQATAQREPATHWDAVYWDWLLDQVSWHRVEAATSLRPITASAPASAAVVDVTAGASPLAEELLAAGYSDVTDLDGDCRARASMPTASRRSVASCTPTAVNGGSTSSSR